MMGKLDGFIFFYTIWDKVSTDIKKEFDGKPVYQKKKKKVSKTKIESHGDEVTDFLIKKFLR